MTYYTTNGESGSYDQFYKFAPKSNLWNWWS